MSEQNELQVDMVTIGSMVIQGVLALMIKAGMSEDEVNQSLRQAVGPQEQ
jgi:hypothetical protein